MDDLISRQAALEKVRAMQTYKLFENDDMLFLIDKAEVQTELMMLPTIQPEKAQLSKEGATSDLISRTATIDAVNNAFDRETLLTVFVRSIALRAIRDMPSAQPEPQWIPVSERLPEESEYYIITANDGVGHRTTFAKFQKKAKSWDLTGARSYWRVIAWMPLPEAYKPNK